MNRKVLVVGGAGYIGSHTCKALQKAGHTVQVFDDLSTGFRELAKFGGLHEASLLDKDEIEYALQKFQPHAVMHFAARAAVGESMTNPSLYYQQNVVGSFHLLEAIRLHAPKTKVIFSSTCSVYGETEKAISESTALAPMNTYARTKRMIEEMLLDYDRAYGISSVILRYFNAAGADGDGEIGEMHNPETHLIPRLLKKSLHAKEDVKIFGKDYSTPDGTCIRDYIHVEDLAEAHVLAMEYLLDGGKSELFNLGTGQGHSVLEVVRAVEKVTGKKLDLPVAPRRAGDPPRLVAEGSKFQKKFSWKPKHDLESIVTSAWNWEKDRP